jgi:peptidoglycan/LPS O-acetylase OafA/YrhL
MAMHTVHRTGYTAARPGLEAGRLLLTLLGGAALVVGAFLNWTRDTSATSITNRSLVKVDFTTRSDIVQTVGGIAILIGIIAVLGLIDRTGWLSRLAGALGIVLFILFAVEVYRSADHSMQAGAWLALVGGVVLIIGGMLAPRTPEEMPTVLEEREQVITPDERVAPRDDVQRDDGI